MPLIALPSGGNHSAHGWQEGYGPWHGGYDAGSHGAKWPESYETWHAGYDAGYDAVSQSPQDKTPHSANGWQEGCEAWHSGYDATSQSTQENTPHSANSWQECEAWHMGYDAGSQASKWPEGYEAWHAGYNGGWLGYYQQQPQHQQHQQPTQSAKKARAARQKTQKAANGNADKSLAQVHFTKTYQVLSDVLTAHAGAFQDVQSFVDLGCAPGGFSSKMVEAFPMCKGFGVTLPVEAGGFPLLCADSRLRVQSRDLMTLSSLRDELDGMEDDVDICIADAQDLGRRTSPSQRSAKASVGAGKSGSAVSGGAAAAAAAVASANAGIKATCTVLGIWALTLQELMLGLAALRQGGTLFFRFGWRGHGDSEEQWYLEATMRLLALVFTLFAEVMPFKSEFSHQADSTFYIVAAGFKREAFRDGDLCAKLKDAVHRVIICEHVDELPYCMDALEAYATEDIRKQSADMLDTVGRMRAIGVASRQRLQASHRSNPEAAVWISPVPLELTMQRLREQLEWYGKITHIRWRSHQVGVGADAVVQFAQRAHAMVALEAITQQKVLGENIVARALSDPAT